MDASVIVCTYNRAVSLVDTLAALAALQLSPGFTWELIVVDNNSRDTTRYTVERFAAEYPALPLRYVFEGQQGLSHARNRGIAEAHGEILAFTDDDVLPAPDWLTLLVQGMRAHGCAAAGGYIAPLWQADPPTWLTERFYGFLALKTDTVGPREVSDVDGMPFGANMAMTRDAVSRVGVFDTELGRKGGVLAGGEEIDMLLRIAGDGGKIMYFPTVQVKHKVEAFRLRKSYFRKWRMQSSSNEAAKWPPVTGRQFGGVPLYLIRQMLRSIASAFVMRILRPEDEAFRQEMVVWHFLGLIHGLARRSRDRVPV